MSGIKSIQYIEEPRLLFANGNSTVDQMVGLNSFGPLGFPDSDIPTPSSIKLGIIGSKQTIDLAQGLIDRLKTTIKSIEAPDFMPPFVGLSQHTPFRCDIEISPSSIEIIKEDEIEKIKKMSSFYDKMDFALDFIIDMLQNIHEREPRPDVLLVALPKEVQELTRKGWKKSGKPDREKRGLPEDSTESNSSYSNLYRAIKIEAMKRNIPTQFLRPRTLMNIGVEDSCTIAWNLAVGLYYKAGGHPWRLEKSAQGTCYVGISFYKSKDESLRTSMAQIFSHLGEGLVLRGSQVDEENSDKSPRLSGKDTESLMKEVLETYKRQMKSLPSRVVIHKSSKFTADERNGFSNSLKDIGSYDLVTLQKSYVRLFRIGENPPIRGTAFTTKDERVHLYTNGYVPFQKHFWGPSVPIPLSILEHYGDTPNKQLCSEILGLTKMNWNTARFCTDMPITLVFAQKVGRILGEIPSNQTPESRYLYYM